MFEYCDSTWTYRNEKGELITLVCDDHQLRHTGRHFHETREVRYWWPNEED